MTEMNALSSLPTAAIIAIGVLGVVQITLDIIALVDLYRRPADQLMIPKKWVWAVIILLVSTLGAVVYLAVGRKPAAAVDTKRERPTSRSASEAVDLLYGEREEKK